ncbi:MAG: aspartate/glutamate racemase family protein [Candidatus Diapherotrites archaeon]|nr:aspartate/glutamate racemase family protein [Candidatus Diapherotrites archaeon]
MGPEATGNFYLNLIKTIQNELKIQNNSQFPQIIINSIPAPELIDGAINSMELEPYFEGIRELNKFGAEYIAMICEVPIIDLREAVQKELTRKKIKTMLVIGTPNTVKTLYMFEGIHAITPTEKELHKISRAIVLFNRGFQKERQKNKIIKICNKYHPQKPETILVGCTELELMLADTKFQKIEPMKILVNAIVEKLAKTRGLKTQKEMII